MHYIKILNYYYCCYYYFYYYYHHLITKLCGYEKEWSALLSMPWQYIMTNCKGHFGAQGLDGSDLGSMGDDKLNILSDPHYKVHAHVSKHMASL